MRGITFSLNLKKFFYRFANCLFPLKCQYCGAYLAPYPKKHLCGDCERQLYQEIKPACATCGKVAKPKDKLPHKCKTCSNKPLPKIVFLNSGLYSGILKELIHKFKYDKKEFLSETLGGFLIDFLDVQKIDLTRFDYVIPVPLSKIKLRQRGFNQSELIAFDISKHYGVALNIKAVRRRNHKYSQAGLNRTERLYNLAGVFYLAEKHSLAGKSVVLIDDVKSTGSTLRFCSDILFSGGVKHVLALALADNP